MALPLAALLMPVMAMAQQADPKPWQLNMGEGVSQYSHQAYGAHMLAFWICVGIGIVVFGAMAVAMFKFRKSKGARPDVDFTHSTQLEILWTAVPVLLLIVMAVPATKKLMAMSDVRNADMTVKITGYQWLWKYEYPGEKPEDTVAFTSRLARSSEEMRQSGKVPTMADNRYYLLDVDHPLVLPADTKIHLLIHSDDVIHAWWVPALAPKQDAIPGIVNDTWTQTSEPGIYRGQCAELCGKDHGFMPIVVKVLPKEEFKQWLAAERAKNAPAAAPVAAAAPAAPAAEAPAADATAPAAPAADKNATATAAKAG